MRPWLDVRDRLVSKAGMKTTSLADPNTRIAALWTDSIDWITVHSAQIIIATVLAGIVAALLLGAKWLGRRMSKRFADHNHWPRIVGGALAKIRLWFIVAIALQVIATYSHAPDDLAKTVYFLFVIAVTLQAAVFAREIILGIVEYRAQTGDGQVALASALNIIRLLVTIVLFAVAAILILSNLGVNVTGLIAGLGVGGIAIGLAAQGIFADLFAALAILFDRPFRKGDAIRVDTLAGTVEDIGLKSTRIRAITGEQIIVANKQLLEKEIHNLARLDRRRIIMNFGLVQCTPIDQLDRIPVMMGEAVAASPPASLVRCALLNFSPSALDFELQYDVHSEDYDTVFSTRHKISIAILRRFEAEGIRLANPTQIGFTGAPDGRLLTPDGAS
jgi:small-conductance mechanosensitive channel